MLIGKYSKFFLTMVKYLQAGGIKYRSMRVINDYLSPGIAAGKVQTLVYSQCHTYCMRRKYNIQCLEAQNSSATPVLSTIQFRFRIAQQRRV